MKRYFKSGYPNVQDIVLEPGTYTFWAYIKSEFGDIYTFSLLNEASERENFDIDVEMGKWTKAYEVFTITEKKTRIDLFARFFDSEQPVFLYKPQLIKGNIPSDAGASPFDIDSIVDDLHDNIDGIADFTNEEFADRVLSASERVSLKREMEAVESIFQSLRGSYEKLVINPFVPAEALSDLTLKYNSVMTAKTTLFNVLNLIIAGDEIVTPEEITAKDNALLTLNAALYSYNLAEKEITNALGEDYTQKISAIRDFTDDEFADRMLSETERISLSHDLDNVQTVVDNVTSRFNELLLNPFITEADRDLLIEKYNALLDAWDWDEDADPSKPNGLKTIILNIINDPDNLIDPDEMLEKDLALSAFNLALGEFSATEVYISKIIVEYAIDQATFWSIHATSPVIYKDSRDAVTDGYHMPITVKGQLHRGTQIQDGGYITVTADEETEAVEASFSPVLIEPLDYDDKSYYTIRLYDSKAKNMLLDTMTIPVIFRGANGKDAVNITLSNEIDSVPASSTGVVSNYANTGTDIRVFEGTTELTYDGVGISLGTFKVTSIGINLSVGQISSPTLGILKCVIGNVSNLTADKGITQFTVSGRTLEGEPFSIVVEQSITKGRKGDTGNAGEDGDGITSTTIEYAKSSSGITPPISGWSTSLPSPTQGWYLWTRTTTTYKVAETTVAYSVSHWAADGEPGGDGKGVSSVVTWYYKSSSATQLQGGSWSTTKPSYSTSFYLWIKTITTYTDNSTSETTPIIDPDWHKVMAITDKFGTTVDGGLISTVMMLLRELNSTEDTAGISGIQRSDQNDPDNLNAPAFWAGGTYEQAFSFIEFLFHMKNGTPPGINTGEFNYVEAYNNLPEIVMLHNGAAKTGDFIIEDTGQVVIIDPAIGIARLTFSTHDIPTIESLRNNYFDSGSVDIWGGIEGQLTGTLEVDNDGTSATFNGVTLNIEATGYPNEFNDPAKATLYYVMEKDGNWYKILGQIELNFWDQYDPYQYQTRTFGKEQLILDKGTYTFRLATLLNGNVTVTDAYANTTTIDWRYDVQGVNRQQYGRNGMMFYYEGNHFHFTKEKGFDVRGEMNMPGILAAGSSTSGGAQSNIWGAKANSSGVTPITGGFRVPLKDLTHNQYVVQVTPHTSTTFRVGLKTSNYFEVFGVGGFDYVVIGKNYP